MASTVSLRDAARELAQIEKRQEKLASGRLLSVLKSGEIEAGVRIPEAGISWLSIPSSFWASIGNDEFRRIGRSKKRGSGAFKVRIGHFADQITAEAMEGSRHSTQPNLQMWTRILRASIPEYEVEISEEKWQPYCERLRALRVSSGLENKSTRGRPEKNWRDIMIIVGAYLIKHHETNPTDRIKTEHASKRIRKIAEDRKLRDIPSAGTIKDQLSEVLRMAKEISIN